MNDDPPIVDIIKACIPLVCIFSFLFIAIVRPDNKEAQIGLLTMGATAFTGGKKNGDRS